jgi:hypothetical protein
MGEESLKVACREEMDGGRKLENMTSNTMQEFDLRIERRLKG